MAGQRPFNPGVSLAGAVDLEALKHQVKAEPGPGWWCSGRRRLCDRHHGEHVPGHGADVGHVPDPVAAVGADR